MKYYIKLENIKYYKYVNCIFSYQCQIARQETTNFRVNLANISWNWWKVCSFLHSSKGNYLKNIGLMSRTHVAEWKMNIVSSKIVSS